MTEYFRTLEAPRFNFCEDSLRKVRFNKPLVVLDINLSLYMPTPLWPHGLNNNSVFSAANFYLLTLTPIQHHRVLYRYAHAYRPTTVSS